MNASARRHLLSLLMLATAVAAAWSACSRKVNSPAVGKWRTEGSKDTIEFRADGTCQGKDQYGREVSGNFTLVESNLVKLELTTSSEDKAQGTRFVEHAAGVASLRVAGDELTMTDEAGSAIHYRRQK